MHKISIKSLNGNLMILNIIKLDNIVINIKSNTHPKAI